MNYFPHKCYVLLCAAIVLVTIASPTSVIADETTEQAVEETSPDAMVEQVAAEPSPDADTPEIPQEVLDYELPFPGILPDHPLYSVKLFRDRLLDYLIRDSNKRIEFNLLMADKRLNMGVFLAEKEDWERSEEIVSKGEKYFVNAVDGLYSARDEGRDVPADLPERLLLSIQKHRMIIDGLKEQAPESVRPGFESSLQTVSESHGRITDFGM